MRLRSLSAAFAVLFCNLASVSANSQDAKLLSLLDGKVKRIDQAFVKGDLTAVYDLMPSTMMITNPVGAFVSRDEVARSLQSGQLKYTSAEASEEKLVQFGDVAVFTYLSTETGTMQGHDISGKYRYTGVWARQGGEWKLVVAQITQVIPQS